jgi:hypothetical protein
MNILKYLNTPQKDKLFYIIFALIYLYVQNRKSKKR